MGIGEDYRKSPHRAAGFETLAGQSIGRQAVRSDCSEHAGVDVEQIALEREPPGRGGVGDPREGQEVREREPHDFCLDPAEPPLRRLARRDQGRLADPDPGGDEVARLRRGPIGHRLDAAALAVAEHDELGDLQHLHPEFERRAGPVIAGVRLIGRHEGRDVAHDEELARNRGKHRLRVDARIRAGDRRARGSATRSISLSLSLRVGVSAERRRRSDEGTQ